MSQIPLLEDVLERARSLGSLDDCLAGLATVLGLEFSLHRIVVGLLHPDRERLVLVGVWTSGPTQVRPDAVVRTDATAFPRLLRGEEIVALQEEDGPEGLPLLEKVLWTEGIRSALSIPLREGATPSGILILASRVPGAFPEGQRLLFGTLGILCEATLLELGRPRVDDVLRREAPDAGGGPNDEPPGGG
jgi:GAF domain-containing protein